MVSCGIGNSQYISAWRKKSSQLLVINLNNFSDSRNTGEQIILFNQDTIINIGIKIVKNNIETIFRFQNHFQVSDQ